MQNGGATSWPSALPSSGIAIEKMIIFHLQLPELSGQPPLSESASLEELYEQVLYFNSNQQSTDQAMLSGPDHIHDSQSGFCEQFQCQSFSNMKAAVQFAGLCTALRNIPNSLGSIVGHNRRGANCYWSEEWSSVREPSKNERANVVKFGNSVIVTVQLEATLLGSSKLSQYAQVLAAVQLPQYHSRPAVVKESIEACHHLFKLFRGGGIIWQLSQQIDSLADGRRIQTDISAAHANQNTCNGNDEKLHGDQFGANSQHCFYPGMDRLYSVRKRIRKIKDRTRRNREEPNDKPAELDSIYQDVHRLSKILPIYLLRQSLSIHYDEYISNVRSSWPERSMISPPGPERVSSVKISTRIGIVLRNLTQESIFRPRDDILPLAISAFHNRRLLCTHAPQKKDEVGQLLISDETVYMVVRYMMSYRTKMQQVAEYTGAQSVEHRPLIRSDSKFNVPGIKELAFAIGQSNDGSPPTNDDVVRAATVSNDGNCHFLPPPPLFMMSALDHAHCLPGPNDSAVWAPLIHLPSASRCLKAHVALFEATDGLCFLVFMDLGNNKQEATSNKIVGADTEGKSSCVSFLTDASQRLIEISQLVAEGILVDEDDVQHGKEKGETKQESSKCSKFALVDHCRRRLFFSIGARLAAAQIPSISSALGGKSKMSKKKQAKRLLLKLAPGLNIHSTSNLTGLTAPMHRLLSSETNWKKIEMDDAHDLVFHFAPDIVEAFESMMDYVTCYRQKRPFPLSEHLTVLGNTGHDTEKGNLELYAQTAQGWVYMRCNDGDTNDVYGFLGAGVCARAQDLAKVVRIIRRQLFYSAR